MMAPVSDLWDTLSPRVVMVARYAEGDGIGRYATQLAATHQEGRTFVRVGIPEGSGDYSRPLHRGPRALWLLRDAHRGDDVLVHYHPHYYVRGGGASRIACHLSWGLLGLMRRLTVVAHEADAAPRSKAEEAAMRWGWRRAGRVVFHSGWERDRHVTRFGSAPRQHLVVVPHGDFFRSAAVAVSRAEARRSLGLPAERTILLMIGFISAASPDKGYDRALKAVRAADEPGVELHIVGSPIRQGAEVEALLARLRVAAAGPHVSLHEQFVDDDTFDLWIRAADAVLTPYRTASSSGVIARAHLLGTRVVTSDVGGLAEQADAEDIVIGDDAELVEAVRRLARQPRRSSSSR